jgi:hypothetical protein
MNAPPQPLQPRRGASGRGPDSALLIDLAAPAVMRVAMPGPATAWKSTPVTYRQPRAEVIAWRGAGEHAISPAPVPGRAECVLAMCFASRARRS